MFSYRSVAALRDKSHVHSLWASAYDQTMTKESWASSPAARSTMRANRSRDTKIELAVRKIVFARGMRYRVDARPEPSLRRKADLVFRGPKIAVFLDGCFWHGCPVHYIPPKTNDGYWGGKVGANRARDVDTTEKLREAGWAVLRFWEHEDPAEIAEAIELAVRGGRSPAEEPEA